MLPQYEDWESNCSKTLGDLSKLRQWLERHDAPRDILDIRDKLKKQILIAQTMIPPPDDDTDADQDVTVDDFDTTILDDLNETYGDAVSAVRRPVSPPSAPVTGDQDPPEPVPEAQTTSELTTVERLDKQFQMGLKISLAITGIDRGNWVLPEDERIIDIPDLKDYRDRGLLRVDEGWEEYYEEVKELTEPPGSKTKMACQMCIQQGKSGGRYSVANLPSQYKLGITYCSLMSHIRQYHRDILITPVKCGCDGAGRAGHKPEGYTYFHEFRRHIQGVQKANGETYYNIHYRARKARDEQAIMERHDDFANELDEAEEMTASRRRVSLDLDDTLRVDLPCERDRNEAINELDGAVNL